MKIYPYNLTTEQNEYLKKKGYSIKPSPVDEKFLAIVSGIQIWKNKFTVSKQDQSKEFELIYTIEEDFIKDRKKIFVEI